MSASYQDFEDIQDFLPGEGESVVVYRKNGKLHARPHSPSDNLEELFDNETAGELLVLTERLNDAGSNMFLFFLAITIAGSWAGWKYYELGLSYWYIHAIFLFAMFMIYGYYAKMVETSVFKHSVVASLELLAKRLQLSEYQFLSMLHKVQALETLASQLREYLARGNHL